MPATQSATPVIPFQEQPERAFNGLELNPDLESRPTTTKGIAEVIRSDRFKDHLQIANLLSNAEGVQPWGSRVVWSALVYGHAVAKRYACRNKKSRSFQAYENLRLNGCFVEDENRLGWEDIEPDDYTAWMFTLMRVASQ